MKRVLLYPNISILKNPEKDVYLQFLRKLIFSLKLIRNDIYWYCIIPEVEGRMAPKAKYIKKFLQFPNIKFLEVSLPQSPTDRYHFDMLALSKKIQWRDIIFSNTHIEQ